MNLRIAAAISTALACSSAHAWDCNYWSQSSNPSAECYKAPAQPASQTQRQGQGQSQNAYGGSSTSNAAQSLSSRNTASSGSTATGGSGYSSSSASGGAGGSQSQGISTSSVNSGNYVYGVAANTVNPAAMIIQGCAVMGQAGGSNTRASAMLGIGFTPKNCYDYIQAQAYLAIGATQAACEILNNTEAARRAVKNGAHLPDCTPVVVVQQPAEPMYTRQQVDQIVKKAVRK